MGLSKKVLIVANTFEILGINKLFYKLNKNRKKIVAYHNVVSDKFYDGKLHLDYSISESAFRSQIEEVKKHCSVDLDFSNLGTTQITFDDGYLNQVSKATKILDEYGLKGIVFCAADLIDNKKPLDMELVMYWFSYVKEGVYTLSDINLTLDIEDNNFSRGQAFRKAEALVNADFTLADLVKELEKVVSYDLIKFDGYDERFKGSTLEDLNEMKSRGHLVGAHSSRHYNLAKMGKSNLEADIDNCGKLLKDGVYNTDVFCYPYGSRGDIPSEMPMLLERNKFKVALAYGNNPNDTFDKYYIPRIMLPPIENKAGINFILSGARHFLVFRKLFPKYTL